MWGAIQAVVSGIVSAIANNLQAVWGTIGDGVTTAFNGIKEIFSNVWNYIKTLVLGVVLVICDLVTGDLPP